MSIKAVKVVAIHQPNFFPWLGYFDKIARSDVFVLLDDVQFPKTGGTWVNRVRVLINGNPAWLTVPVVRDYHGVRRISEIEINNTTPVWREKMIKTIQVNYSRTPYFRQIFPFFVELISNSDVNLSQFNIRAITELIDSLGWDSSKLVLNSTIRSGNTQATDLIIQIVKNVNGSEYLSGDGADGYQEEKKFYQADLRLTFQKFCHPSYPQFGVTEFKPGLSVLDALMNIGFEGVNELYKKSRKERGCA